MSIEHKIRVIAGSFIIISLILSQTVSVHFLWFTAFVGLNLIQSAFTKWCLMERFLTRMDAMSKGGAENHRSSV